MAIHTSTSTDGKVLRHITVTRGEAAPCAVAHGEIAHVRNTGKLRLTSNRCPVCFPEYTAREKKAGTFEFGHAGGKDRTKERARLLDGYARMTPAERKALVLGSYARGLGIKKSDLAKLAPAPAAPAAGKGKGKGAPAVSAPPAAAAGIAAAAARGRAGTPAASVAASAAAAIAQGANSQ